MRLRLGTCSRYDCRTVKSGAAFARTSTFEAADLLLKDTIPFLDLLKL